VQKDCKAFRKFFVISKNSQMIGPVKELVEAERRQEAVRKPPDNCLIFSYISSTIVRL